MGVCILSVDVDVRKYSILAIGILVLVFIVLFAQLVAEKYVPMDYNIFRSAVQVWEKGGDPYDIVQLKAVTGHDYPFRYPVITLYFFKFLSPLSHLIWWGIISVLIFVLMMFVDKKFDWILFFVVLTTGYMTLFKNFTIGNIGIIDLLFFTFVFLALSRKLYWLAAVLVGMNAIFKTVPLVYSLLFIMIPLEWYKRAGLVLLSWVTFAGLHLVSYLISPDLSRSFYNLLFNGYPMLDARGFFNPSSYAFIKDIFRADYYLYAYLPYLLIIGLFGLLIWIKRKEDWFIVYCFGILAIMLSIPELKHYTYVMAIIPTYFILKEFDFLTKFYTIILICFVPMAVYMSYLYLEIVMPTLKNTVLDWFYWYTPLFVLMITYFVLGLKYIKQKRIDYIEIDTKCLYSTI